MIDAKNLLESIDDMIENEGLFDVEDQSEASQIPK